MQRTKSKILSILLSLVMLLSLLPTTALAASPTYVTVYNENKKLISLNDGECLTANDAENATSYTSGDPYVARYASGTLYLKGYDGGQIKLDGAERKELTIKLIGDNKITVNGATATGIYVSSQKSNITITADSGDNGKLVINADSGTGDAVGIGNNTATGAKPGNVTIKGHADVTINAKTLGKNRNSWGIYADAVVIEENAKVAITVEAPMNTEGDLVYGIYAKNYVTIDTAGEITVDAHNAGTGEYAYSFGVKSKGNLFLKNVGGMTVRWNDEADGFGYPLSPAKEFDSSKYDKILDKTNCSVTYTPKVSASVGTVTIDGVKGSPITDAEVKIKLTNDTFTSPLSGNWITNLPAGLSQSVSRTDDTHATITVSGTPTETSYDALIIKIPAGNLVTRTSDLDVPSTINARYKITAAIAVPTANSVTYDGTEKTGVNDGTGYILGGTYKAIDASAADYTATATLNTGYKWDDYSTGVKTIKWNIGKRTPTATDFIFAPPATLTYDGNNKTASVTLKSPLTKSGTITPTYMKDGAVVTETKDAGTYTVKIDVAGGDNFNADSNLTDPAWTFSIAPADQSAPTGLGVAAPTTSSGNGKITGTNAAMEYNTDAAATSGWTACSATETEVAPDTYYVRFKADSNHHAGATATVTVPAYSATKYTVTVTSDANGTAGADKTANVAAGETVTLTATPNSGYVFDKWDNKTPAGLTIGADGKFTMPSANVSVKATFTPAAPIGTASTPTFTPNGVSGFTGTQSVKISCTTVGATIHYTTDGTEPTASSPVYSAELSLTSTTTVKAIAVKAGMNNSAIATATFTKYSGGGGGGGGSYTPSYTVSVDKTENGTITVSPKSASKGDTVTITVKPDKGYELEMLKALDKDGDALKLTEKNGKYTFTMPTGKVTVKGSFVEEAPVQIFKDVPVDAYYYEAVKWAAEKGITGGVGSNLFAPNQPCTRAQIVTFLWRAAGSPAPKNMSSFADVPADAFYAKAVAWAVENGITGGTGDGKFSPDATCTRAQSVTFLYRAAGSPKVSGSAEFGDVAANAYYADAVAWAAKNGVTDGVGGGLFGSGSDCTRAQIVTFLYRAMK